MKIKNLENLIIIYYGNNSYNIIDHYSYNIQLMCVTFNEGNQGLLNGRIRVDFWWTSGGPLADPNPNPNHNPNPSPNSPERCWVHKREFAVEPSTLEKFV